MKGIRVKGHALQVVNKGRVGDAEWMHVIECECGQQWAGRMLNVRNWHRQHKEEMLRKESDASS